MVITYANEFYPMQESIAFLNDYMKEKSYKNDTNYDLGVEDQQLLERCLTLLDEIKNDMGLCLENKHNEKKYLFSSVFPNDYCFATAILRSCFNYSLHDTYKQKQCVIQKYEKDPLILLRAYCCTLLGDSDYRESSENELLTILQQSEIEDKKKWSIVLNYLKGKEVLEDLFQVLKDMLPIFKKYATRCEEFLQYYKQQQQEEYEEGDMFLHLVKTHHFEFASNQDEPVYIVPSLSCYRSLEFRFEYQLEDKNILLVQWGIGILKGLEDSIHTLSEETICNNLKLLSDKSKFEILRYLSKHSAYGAELAKEFHLTTATITYHMQALLDANFVRFEKKGNRIYYFVDEEFLDNFFIQVRQRMQKE